MMIQFEKIRGDVNPGQGINAPAYHVPNTTRHDSNNPMMGISVGLREGRLSERSPADHHRVCESRALSTVQGGHLSHSFSGAAFKRSEFTQALIDAIAILFAFLFVALGLCVGGAILAAVILCLFRIAF